MTRNTQGPDVQSGSDTREAGLSIIIPAFNEEEGLPGTLDSLLEVATSLSMDWEILVVDDGSTDRTAEIAAAKGARVIRHPLNAGYGASLKHGIRAARYDVIAMIDADGTYPADHLPAMLEKLHDVDLVVGARTGALYRRRALLSPVRTLFLLLTNFVTGTWIPDPNSGFRVFRRETAMELLEALPRAFSFTTTMTLLMTLQGSFIRFHPVPYLRRHGKRKIRAIRDTLRMFQTLTEVILQHNPLKLFLLVGLLPILLAPLAALLAAPSLGLPVATILFSAGLVIFGQGLLASSMMRNRKPRDDP